VQKEELLHLHMLFIHVKKYYETITNAEIPTERYNSLDISPVHIHKNKKCHMEAILVLGEEIVSHLKNESPVDFQQDHIPANAVIQL
jgi:hypothetical protein